MGEEEERGKETGEKRGEKWNRTLRWREEKGGKKEKRRKKGFKKNKKGKKGLKGIKGKGNL